MTLCYFELNDGADEVPNNLLAGMLRLRHSCNPDFEKQYPSVVKWYAEIDPFFGMTFAVSSNVSSSHTFFEVPVKPPVGDTPLSTRPR